MINTERVTTQLGERTVVSDVVMTIDHKNRRRGCPLTSRRKVNRRSAGLRHSRRYAKRVPECTRLLPLVQSPAEVDTPAPPLGLTAVPIDPSEWKSRSGASSGTPARAASPAVAPLAPMIPAPSRDRPYSTFPALSPPVITPWPPAWPRRDGRERPYAR